MQTMKLSLSRERIEFGLKYLLGKTPWDTETTPPELVELVEERNTVPGRALDLGCGTGTNTIYLAKHGWEAVGVDFSALAVWQARWKAHRARVDCRFYRADVTDLSFLDRPFDLALDIGCLHSLARDARRGYAAGLARLVKPGGLYMLYAFLPRETTPARGIAPGEVSSLFAGAFALKRQEGGDDPNGPSSAWYWLGRLAPNGRQPACTPVLQERAACHRD
jgi:SAM-dependent methyltransferase